jgi:inosose dehydratase
VRDQIAFLKSVGATDIVVAELGAAVNQVRTKSVLNDRPELNEAQWYLLASGLNEAGKLARANDMQLCYHPHVGTGVQDQGEIDRLFSSTDPHYVGMCLDTGHADFAGVDPVALTAKYIHIIRHVHLKDIRPHVRDRAISEGYSFYQAIREGIFTVPGDPEGGIDFEKIFSIFRNHGYEGWIVVEAEQDPAKANPLKYAQMSRQYLREHLGC